MHRPSGLNILFDYNAKTKKKKGLPKSLAAFFLVMTYILGMDFGFTVIFPSLLRKLAKVLANAYAVFIIFILTTALNGYDDDVYYCYLLLLQYLYFFIMIRTTKYTLCDFLLELYKIDTNITRINKERIGIVTWLYCSALYSSKSIIHYMYCTHLDAEGVCNNDFIPYYVYSIPCLGLDLAFVVLILIYYHIFCCIDYLYHSWKKNNVNVLHLKRSYIGIAECYDKIRPFYDKLLIAELLFEVPKMMGLIWHMLRRIKDQDAWYLYLSEYLYAAHIMSHILCAAMMVQLTGSKAKNLKIELHNTLIEEQDSENRAEISRLLKYMDTRALQYDVIGIVPTDLRLCANCISVCATYMVVVVQFTHLYD